MTESSSPVERHFRELFEKECSYVCRSLRRLGVAERDIADVAHEVFLVVHRQLPECDLSRPIRPWLFVITARAANDYRQLARVRKSELVDVVEAVDGGPSPDESLMRKDLRRLVYRALEDLDMDRRTVLVMHDLDGYGAPEIAEALQIPLNTVYSRLRLARKECADSLRRLRAQGGAP